MLAFSDDAGEEKEATHTIMSLKRTESSLSLRDLIGKEEPTQSDVALVDHFADWPMTPPVDSYDAEEEQRPAKKIKSKALDLKIFSVGFRGADGKNHYLSSQESDVLVVQKSGKKIFPRYAVLGTKPLSAIVFNLIDAIRVANLLSHSDERKFKVFNMDIAMRKR